MSLLRPSPVFSPGSSSFSFPLFRQLASQNLLQSHEKGPVNKEGLCKGLLKKVLLFLVPCCPQRGAELVLFFLKETQFQGCITRRLNCTNVHTFGLLMPKGLSRRRSEMNFWFQISSDEFMAMCSLRHSDVTWLSHCQRLCVANATFVYMSRFTCVFIFRQKKMLLFLSVYHPAYGFLLHMLFPCFSITHFVFWLVVHQVWIWEERFT